MILKDIPYKTGGGLTEYEIERCKFDLYLPDAPSHSGPRPLLVWFHGGGLTEVTKEEVPTVALAKAFAEAGVAVALPDYQLSPRVKYPTYLQDAAAAYAWIFRHAKEYGSDTEHVFLGGHSAGGYLAAMLGMDPRYLREQGLDASALAGFIALSAQVTTHFTVRAERGLPPQAILADDASPIYHTRQNTPPFLMLVGDRDIPGRAKENDYFYEVLQIAGNQNVSFQIVENRDHMTILEGLSVEGDPVRQRILSFVGMHR